MLPKRLFLFGVILLYTGIQTSFAQCAAPASPPMSTLADLTITNGETLNGGTTKWNKGVTTMGSLTLNGGTLIVDGNLTLSSLALNSGEIIIRPGATLSITPDNIILNGNARIFNYGNFNVYGHIYMMNSTSTTPNCIVNATPDATISTPANSLYIMSPYSKFINNGKADLGWIYTASNSDAGSIMLNDGSETTVGYIHNNRENSIAAPDGKACVSVTKTYNSISKPITNSPNVKLAFTGPSSCSGCTASPWGDAEIFTSIPSCSSITPLAASSINFKAAQQNNCNILSWQVNTNTDPIDYILEHSTNGINYQDHTRLPNQATSQYRVRDCSPVEGTNYYRLKVVNKHTNTISYSEIRTIKSSRIDNGSAYPNPFINEFVINQPSSFTANSTGILRNALGQQVPISISKQANALTVSTPASLRPGIYFFQLSTETGTYNYRLVKK